MGREWYQGGRSICSSKSHKKTSETSGCITALYHFFHFHHFYFPSRHHYHQPSIDSPSRNLKGSVAPRNSLDLTEESPLSTNYKLEKGILNIHHVGGKKSTLGALLVDGSSSNCNSPRTKTPGPNVVARLMGLDLLPDTSDLNRSPRIGVKGHKFSGNGLGTRSLPVSPRISSDSDNRRLSLQLNRENKHDEKFARKRLKELKQDEGSPSPRHSKKQIKEIVANTREFGMDITNLLENTRARATQNKIEYSRFSQKENTTTSTNPTFVSRQDHISQKRTTKVTLSKDFKENLKGVPKEPKLSPHPTPKTRKAFTTISKHVKSDSCDLLEKKRCNKISRSNDTTTTVNISVASSAFSATERPRKQMKRAEEQDRNADAKICSVQMYKYEKKLHQEQPRSNFYDSTTISATLTNPGGAVVEMKKLKEEEERVVAEIETHIVDALVHETVETMSFLGLNANAVRCAERRQDLAAILKQRLRLINPNNVRFTCR